MNILPKVVTQLCPEQELNPRPEAPNALPVAPPLHSVDLSNKSYLLTFIEQKLVKRLNFLTINRPINR